MKKSLLSKSLVAGAVLALAACASMHLQKLVMPNQVKPGETFTVEVGVGEFNGATDPGTYALVGIRVPADWTVEAPANSWQHIPGDGSEVQYAGTLVPSATYTAVLEARNPVEGYKWFGFITDTKAFNKDGRKDTGVAYLKVTAGNTEGDYVVDVVVGDDEGALSNYPGGKADVAENERICSAATFEGMISDGCNVVIPGETEGIGSNKVKVSNEEDGVESVIADKAVNIVSANGKIFVKSEINGAIATAYDLNGREIDSQALVNGAAELNANPGVCVVKVLKGRSSNTQKVVVR